MIPILYDAAETAFETNGIGILSDAIDVTVEEELNGIFELEMQYPVNGIHFSNIVERAIILAEPNPMTDPQPFRIYRSTKPLNGIVRFYARHIAYDLKGIPVSPFTATGAAVALQSLKTYAATDCPFQFSTDKAASGTFTVSVPASIWSLLGGQEGSVLDVFGGEYEFDRWNVNLLTRRGMDRGVSIRYGKNLTSFEQDKNCASCCTGLYPYWTDTDGNLVELPEKIIRADGNFGYEDIRPMDFSSEWDNAPTEAQLRARTVKYITDNEIGVPNVSWTVEFAALEQTEEYKGMALLERVLLGDTVHVEFPGMGVSASARAVSVKYKPLLDRYEKITLGRVKTNLASTIVKQKQEIDKKPNMDALQRAATIAAKAILGAKGGSVQMLDTDGDGKEDTIYIADNADPALAQKVWRWNYEGWAASKTGYDGPFTMAATLEDGLLADFVTAAHLIAGTIQSPDGSLFIDLDNGIIRMQAISDIEDDVKKLDQAIKEIDGNFFYVKYSQYSDGRNMTDAPTADTLYMGTCSSSTQIMPTDPAAYIWVRVRGYDGTNGTAGTDGKDGKSQYFHVKYSNDGKTFTSNGGETLGDWMGTCVNETESDPTVFSAYTWRKIIGEDGQPGIDGVDGHDGVSSYFFVKFSANANGNPMTETPNSQTKYMGVCSTTSPTAPTSYTSYRWAQCRGNDGTNGTPGTAGADGRTSYLHIKYSDDGLTFTANNGEELGAYIGTLVDFTEADSTNFGDYTWKKFTEDVDEQLDEIKKTIQEQYTQIINDNEEIIMNALESYVETSRYEEFRKATESQLRLFSEQMTLKFSETTSQIATVNGDLQTKFNTITKYFTFDVNGMTIGAADNPNKVVIDNDEISILVNGVVVQRFDANGKALIPELNITQSLHILGYLIEADGNGNVNCEYVGG